MAEPARPLTRPHESGPVPVRALRSGPLKGTIRVPGDKSVSHRALLIGAMALGETVIEGLLEGEDVLATAAAVRALGAEAVRGADGLWRVHGVGPGGWREPDQVLDFGNAGTGVRLMMGAVATSDIAVTFTGDASLRRRPMGRVLTPLALFGTASAGRRGGLLPLTLTGAANPRPVTYRLPVASAQVKSAVLLAGLNAPGETIVIEREATRDHTERMLRGFGASVIEDETEDGTAITVGGYAALTGIALNVPGDPSSAAFPLAAALLVPDSAIRIEGVMLNPTRTGFFETLREMGADLMIENRRLAGGEEVGDLIAKTSALAGIEVPPERAPSMIDEYPMLAVLAASASGRTIMRGLGELRVKESDRLAAIARGLEGCGVTVAIEGDDLIVEGCGGLRTPARIATHMDHRIAMSFLIGGLAAPAAVEVDDAAFIATSFPGFLELMTSLGAGFGRPNR
jgi:3-phosphoshikimate 1-carboxyvinyltransferase